MDEDSSSVEIVTGDDQSSPKIKEEPIIDSDIEEETECVLLLEENEDDYDQEQDARSADPENLLEELTDKQSQEEDFEEKIETDNEGETEEGEKLRRFAEAHEWCFVEAGCPTIYCLFCNVDLKWPSAASLVKHQHSCNHKDRQKAYLDFQNQLNKDVKRLASNRDFDGIMKDAKEHRQKLEEDFANYLWDKWEEKHDWLVRTDVCFIGYCKYCHMKISVANAWSRKTHEEGARHKECKSNAPKRRNTVCGDLPASTSNENNMDKEGEVEKFDGKKVDEWFEKSKSSSDLCRCKLCDITMFKASYYKHVLSNLHKQNISALHNPSVSEKLYKPDWENIAKSHEWLTEDPTDPMEAFCKFCNKRMAYGSSAAKRLIHEHSFAHRAAAKVYKNSEPKNEDGVEVKKRKESEDNEEEENEVDKKAKLEIASESGETTQSAETDLEPPRAKKRPRGGRQAMNEKFPWAKVYRKDPKFISCQYCKVLLGRNTFNGKKHGNTSRHKEAELKYLEKVENENQSNDVLSEQPQRSDEPNYPWLVKYRYGVDYVYCKYCDFIFPRKANRANHELSKRHQDAEKAILAKNEEGENKTLIKTPKSAPADPTARKSPKASKADIRAMKVKIMDWQKRFTWLRFKKGLLLNYAFCFYCNKSVYMSSTAYASKHQRSAPHNRARREMRKQKRIEAANKPVTQLDEVASEKSATSSATTDSSKRSRASSLKNAIETAKRLTAAHMEMMSFMQNNGQKKSDIVQIFQPLAPTPNVNTHPTPPPLPAQSPSVDSNATLPIGRDPFDLFFNSMSESIKRLPADLASEGKLKVMQIIFELEIRSQQRQNQTDIMCTSSTSSFNGSILNTTNDNELLRIPSDSAAVSETLINSPVQQTQQQQYQQQQHQQHQQQQHSTPQLKAQQHQPMQQQTPVLQQQHQQQQAKRTPKTFNIQPNTTQNSMLQQQLMQPQQPLQQQKKQQNFVMQNQSHSTYQNGKPMSSLPLQSSNSSPQQRQRSLLMKTPPMSGNQMIRDNSPKFTVLSQQRPASNITGHANINQRVGANNTSSSYSMNSSSASTPTSTTTSASKSNRHFNNVGTFFNDPRGNNNNNNNTNPTSNINSPAMQSIRPVPLSSLIVNKYSSDEPQIHHIQLNSSTQSKIIPLETGKNSQR